MGARQPLPCSHLLDRYERCVAVGLLGARCELAVGSLAGRARQVCLGAGCAPPHSRRRCQQAHAGKAPDRYEGEWCIEEAVLYKLCREELREQQQQRQQGKGRDQQAPS